MIDTLKGTSKKPFEAQALKYIYIFGHAKKFLEV